MTKPAQSPESYLYELHRGQKVMAAEMGRIARALGLAGNVPASEDEIKALAVRLKFER